MSTRRRTKRRTKFFADDLRRRSDETTDEVLCRRSATTERRDDGRGSVRNSVFDVVLRRKGRWTPSSAGPDHSDPARRTKFVGAVRLGLTYNFEQTSDTSFTRYLMAGSMFVIFFKRRDWTHQIQVVEKYRGFVDVNSTSPSIGPAALLQIPRTTILGINGSKGYERNCLLYVRSTHENGVQDARCDPKGSSRKFDNNGETQRNETNRNVRFSRKKTKTTKYTNSTRNGQTPSGRFWRTQQTIQ
jgi:hypothetical protein